MDATYAKSSGPVEATGPMGQMTAGSAEITRQGDGSSTYLLVFKDGVKLVYKPQTEGEVK